MNRRIHRHALRQSPLVVIAAFDGRQIAPPAENRRNEAVAVRFLHGFINKFFHAAAFFKIACDIIGGFLPRNMKILGKPIVADAVDDAEVHRFCLAAQIGRNIIERYAEYLRRCPCMNILIVQKCLKKIPIL